MLNQPSLIVGGSRGVGAATSIRLGALGIPTIITYNRREAKARAVAEKSGVGSVIMSLDITDKLSLARFSEEIHDHCRELSSVVLCASGGLEPGAQSDYADRINIHGQLDVLEIVLPLVKPCGRIVYLTSHEAHFWGQKTAYGPYAKIAESKHQGESALRARAANGFGSGRGLTVVSADIIAGSATAKLLALKDETLIGRRLEQVERLPTSDDVAAAVQTAVLDSRLGEKTNTIHVWEPDAYYLGSPIPKQNDLKGRA